MRKVDGYRVLQAAAGVAVLAVVVAGLAILGSGLESGQAELDGVEADGLQRIEPIPQHEQIRRQLLAPMPDPVTGEALSPASAREGTGVAVMLDTSRSMSSPPSAQQADGSAKIEIAVRHVVQLVRMLEERSAKQEQPVEVGVFIFNGDEPLVRQVIPLGAAQAALAERELKDVAVRGATPIGQALIAAARELHATGLTRRHVLIITDGQNTQSYRPEEVLGVVRALKDWPPTHVTLVAFDVEPGRFDAFRGAGGEVVGAADERQLQEAIDAVLAERIVGTGDAVDARP